MDAWEAELREQVVEAARAMHVEGLVAGTQGNVSTRCRERILITPAALPYDEMHAEDLVALGRAGERLGGEHEPSSEWRLHVAVLTARPEAGAIVHTHSPHATAWSVLGEELDTGAEDLEHACGGAVRTAPFAPNGSQEIAAGAVEALRDRRAVLLARHGAAGLGKRPVDALHACRVIERQAEVALRVRAARRS